MEISRALVEDDMSLPSVEIFVRVARDDCVISLGLVEGD